MTPKEKAQELFDKFNTFYILGTKCNPVENTVKELCLIAVEEIIQSWQDDGNIRLDKGIINWWIEVKKEIEKL